jgi:hypothetical protein
MELFKLVWIFKFKPRLSTEAFGNDSKKDFKIKFVSFQKMKPT